MVIDFHTHIFPDALAPKAFATLSANAHGLYTPVTDMTHASLLRYMDEAGVDVSVIQPVVTKPAHTVTTNRWAASLASDRIVPFGGINPHTDDYKRDIDFVCSLGLKGLKFHAEYQDFILDAPEMLRIYDYAFSKGLIILQHGGFDPAFPPPFKTSPKQFAHIVDELQGGVMIAAHFGGHGQWDDVYEFLAGKNIYLDTSMGFSYYGTEMFCKIASKHGTDKILFASDSPWSNTKDELAALRSLPLPEADKEAILGGNARRLLAL